MTLSDLLKNRFSVRAFLDKPVSQKILDRIFTDAQLSPSNCNVQPWQIHVVSGAKKDALKDKLIQAVMSGKEPNPDFNWGLHYEGVHRDRQFASANLLYSSMGIDRNDKQSRMAALIRNWTFFNAPHALFFTMEKYLNIMGAVDLGIYAQTLVMLMTEQGISSCFQGALGQFPDPVREFLNIPDELGILFVMSFGYAEESAPINAFRTDREPIANSVKFWE